MDRANYRPISNLSTVSKWVECLVLVSLRPQLLASVNFNLLQSVYCIGHSTEMVIIKIMDDFYTGINSKQLTILVSLDISAAFIICHSKLLQRLWSMFYCTQMDWFVCIKSSTICQYGSVLSTNYILYIRSTTDIRPQAVAFCYIGVANFWCHSQSWSVSSIRWCWWHATLLQLKQKQHQIATCTALVMLQMPRCTYTRRRSACTATLAASQLPCRAQDCSQSVNIWSTSLSCWLVDPSAASSCYEIPRSLSSSSARAKQSNLISRFGYASPPIWNLLQPDLWIKETVPVFKTGLKTYMFLSAYGC